MAVSLARGRGLALDPHWHFHLPADDAPQLTLLRRDIWAHYREHPTDAPIVFRWYEGLRVRVFLGNDLSLCLFVLGAYDPNEFVLLRRILEPGMVMLDGGANEGLYSLYASRRVGAQGLVLAVEPSTREFERLEANLALNRLVNVQPLKVALASRAGDAQLAVAYERHAGLNTLEPKILPETADLWGEVHETVQVDTIDALVTRYDLQRLDVIKLDIEGSEVDALEGARATISRFRPTIFLEAEDVRLATRGRSKEDLVQAVAEIGYDLWVFDPGSGQLRRSEPPASVEGNAIAAPRGRRPPGYVRE